MRVCARSSKGQQVSNTTAAFPVRWQGHPHAPPAIARASPASLAFRPMIPSHQNEAKERRRGGKRTLLTQPDVLAASRIAERDEKLLEGMSSGHEGFSVVMLHAAPVCAGILRKWAGSASSDRLSVLTDVRNPCPIPCDCGYSAPTLTHPKTPRNGRASLELGRGRVLPNKAALAGSRSSAGGENQGENAPDSSALRPSPAKPPTPNSPEAARKG